MNASSRRWATLRTTFRSTCRSTSGIRGSSSIFGAGTERSTGAVGVSAQTGLPACRGGRRGSVEGRRRATPARTAAGTIHARLLTRYLDGDARGFPYFFFPLRRRLGSGFPYFFGNVAPLQEGQKSPKESCFTVVPYFLPIRSRFFIDSRSAAVMTVRSNRRCT